MDFDWDCLLGKFQPSQIILLGKFQPSQVVCTPRSRRSKIRCSRKTVCANDIQRVYRFMQSQHNVVHETSGPGPEISVHPGVTVFLSFFRDIFSGRKP